MTRQKLLAPGIALGETSSGWGTGSGTGQLHVGTGCSHVGDGLEDQGKRRGAECKHQESQV